MNWKVFLTAFINLGLLAFPQNMIGCGGEEDPHDYYTSFFNKNATDVSGYQPFYYTSLLKFYDDWSEDENNIPKDDKIIREWIAYTRKDIPYADAFNLIYKATLKATENLQQAITKGKAVTSSDSLSKNTLAKFFQETKDSAALQYLLFAKKAEKYALSADWEAPPINDSVELDHVIRQADEFEKKNSNNFFKDKYNFQRCKLAFYNKRFSDCVKWYDGNFPETNQSAVKSLALSYKAGSLFRLGKKAAAAYHFSKAFAQAGTGKKKIFMGFFWATGNCDEKLKDEYTSLCRNDEEKAVMLGMFGLYGLEDKLSLLQAIYKLMPASPMLDILVIREINKIEEQYLTPQLAKEKGGKALYFSWQQNDKGVPKNDRLVKAISLFETIGTNNKTNNRALYLTGAAYLAFINKEYSNAKRLLAIANTQSPNGKVKDELDLINLLILVNEKKVLDAETESAILPSLKWLQQKASKDDAYKMFYRNLFSEIIAQRYEQQKDTYKAALAYGLADLNQFQKNSIVSGGNNMGITFVRNEMNTDQVLKLYALINSKTMSPFESYLVSNASFQKNDVIDVIGTSYLRDFKFGNAVEWLRKSSATTVLETDNYNYTTDKSSHVNLNPFHDCINDWNRYEKALNKPLTKLSLAQKLDVLFKSIDTVKTAESKSAVYYQLATALYNMSYYGNSWMSMAYSRTSSDWNHGNYATNWEKEYYGVYTAAQYYHKAYELSTNKEFKAAARFLEAKCVQRQVPLPAYNYDNADQYEKDMKGFQQKFMNNLLFPTFEKEFGETKFYKYASNRCSYLRDFVKKK